MADLAEETVAIRRKKDFVQQNILRAKRTRLPERRQRYVDTRHGDAHDLKSSGLLPIYVRKKNYGKVPRLAAAGAKTVTDAVKAEAAEYRAVNGDKDIPEISTCRYMDQEERKTLLDGMKRKWDETMRVFQGLPFLADTPPKAQRKARMERELQQLERDIALVERHQHIYVYDADDDDDA